MNRVLAALGIGALGVTGLSLIGLLVMPYVAFWCLYVAATSGLLVGL